MTGLLARYLRLDGVNERLARWCPAAFVPLAHWPLRWHAGLVGLMLAAALSMVWCADQWHRKSNDRLQRQVQELRHRINELGVGAGASTSFESPARGDRAALPSLQAELARAAQRHGLMLMSMQFDHRRSADTNDQGQQVQVAIQLHGPYPAIKAWIADLLARYEWLTLNSISLRRTEAGDDQLEATLTFTAYLQVPQ